MNEAHEQRNQAALLQARFKNTGIVPPNIEWKPTPTAGDMARQVSADILLERDTELPQADLQSKALWEQSDRKSV